MDITGKRILVIGGAGFIGSYVVEELLKEPVGEVVVYDNFCRGCMENLGEALKDPRCRVFEAGGDICQMDILNEAVSQADGVVLLAALWLLQCQDYPRAAFEVNVRGTFNVIESCVRNKIERLVFSSSASVYGDAVQEPMTEEHPFMNKTFYGATKIAGEQFCRAFHHRFGLNYVGLRYMNVYGPRMDYKGAYIAVMMKILDRLYQDLRPLVYGDGSQAYDFVYVRDVARANVMALKANTVDKFYNVGRGEKTSIKELCELILDLTGSPLEIQYEPGGQTFVTNRVGSTELARKDLGFMASIGLREGMQKLIDWHRARTGAKILKDKPARFVVQEHNASHLHWDFRLELDGVLKSWAVPKGIPDSPGVKRLAVEVEDHALDYIDFEGEIAEGEYGAGKVAIWDKGTYTLHERSGDRLTFTLDGAKVQGPYALVRMKEPKKWLLLRENK